MVKLEDPKDTYRIISTKFLKGPKSFFQPISSKPLIFAIFVQVAVTDHIRRTLSNLTRRNLSVLCSKLIQIGKIFDFS